MACGAQSVEISYLDEPTSREQSSYPVRVSVIPDLIIDSADGDVCAVNIIAVAVTDGSDLEPVIASKSIGGLKWTLPDWLGNEP